MKTCLPPSWEMLCWGCLLSLDHAMAVAGLLSRCSLWAGLWPLSAGSPGAERARAARQRIYAGFQDRERKHEGLDKWPVLEWTSIGTGPSGSMKTQRSKVIGTEVSDGVPTRGWSRPILGLESFPLKCAASCCQSLGFLTLQDFTPAG